MPRLSYEESCRWLQRRQLLAAGELPPLPTDPPRHTDPQPGVRFVQAMIGALKLEHLTLPRTFFGRSEFRRTSFRDSDLSESTAHWNDFIHVNFSGANLSRADLRACVFDHVRFAGASLAGVDFRYCGFKDCDFSQADLMDARLTPKTGQALHLSKEQLAGIDWQAEDGDEPEG